MSQKLKGLEILKPFLCMFGFDCRPDTLCAGTKKRDVSLPVWSVCMDAYDLDDSVCPFFLFCFQHFSGLDLVPATMLAHNH